MKKSILAISSAVLLSITQLNAAEENTISVMSFNLRYAAANDANNSWPYRQDIVLHTIEKYSPALIGTQECMMGQSDFILRNAQAYYFYGAGRENSGFGEMAGVFYNKTLCTPMEMGTFWLSETPDVPGSKSWGAACPRTVSWMKVRYLPSQKYFYYFNTHFDHISEDARQGAAKMLLEKVNAIAGQSPVIITGDFNSPENSAAWKVMKEGGFGDAYLTAKKKTGPETTFHGFMKADMSVPNRIDWILTRNVKDVLSYETITFNDNNFYPSDHYPIIAEIEL